MIPLRGKYNSAKIYTDVVDNESISQVIELLNQPFVDGSVIRMMPDIHAGAGCTIGTTMTIKDKICPNLVGVDIGCGMEVVEIKEDYVDFDKLDNLIRNKIPSGFAIRGDMHEFASSFGINELLCREHVDIDRAQHSIGTLGGGNHFIEMDRDDDGKLYLVIHSGSRHLGVEVASYYQKEAYKALKPMKTDISKVIADLTLEGREREIEREIARIKNERDYIPKQLAYVEGALFDNYIHDMKVAQSYANLNRRAMADTIVKGMGFHIENRFTTIHNYIDIDKMILRKGAVSAQSGETLIIPINMRDGSLICTGKGNPEWNCSAPHGAGRLMSRSAAKEAFSVEEYAEQMEGIYTTSVGRGTLDECPMAYKSMEDIVDNISDTVDIQSIIQPVYNFKASEAK